MFANQVVNPTPPPPAPNPPAVWIADVFGDAEAGQVSQGISAMQQNLYATLPSGSSNKGGSPSGYIALVDAIITGAAQKNMVYQPLYTTWPTNKPPVAQGSTQAWLSAPVTANCVIGFGYDWRPDNLDVTAKMLQNFLYNLTTTPGNTVDKITLIGHSMGGLVSRAYLESIAIAPSTKSPQDATILGMIDQLITLGTPHLGAPMALAPISRTLEIVKGLDGEIFFEFLSLIWPALSPAGLKNLTDIIDGVVNSNPYGVSTYELLPPPITPFIATGGNDLPIYPYSNLPAGLQTLLNAAGFQQANLSTALTFFNALSYTKNPNSNIVYQCIYGVVDLLHRSPELKLKALDKTTTGYTFTSPSTLAAVRTVGGGDLVVPKDSAMFVGNSSVTAAQQHEVPGADHMTMPSNPNIWKVVNGLLTFAS